MCIASPWVCLCLVWPLRFTNPAIAQSQSITPQLNTAESGFPQPSQTDTHNVPMGKCFCLSQQLGKVRDDEGKVDLSMLS